jgi:hypothetical protein
MLAEKPSKPRSKPISKLPEMSVTREATPWSFAMGAPESARSSWEPGLWRSQGSEGQRPEGGRKRPATALQERDPAALHAPLAEGYGSVAATLSARALSSGDFVPALREFFGTQAGLSASTITRLTESWQAEREHFMARDLSGRETTSTCGWTASIPG